jgi:methylphosphotriester-DNA--protein-cysteine methyltransferase
VFSRPELRSEHAQPRIGVPLDVMVVVSANGKIFHKSGCPFIHDKASVRTLVARDALRQGYTPCVRCMKEYLSATVLSAPG